MSHPSFIAHNIILDDGSQTFPGSGRLIANWEYCKGALRTLNSFFKDRDRSQIRIADLGCLEGGYSVEFAREGYQVFGIEAREANYQKCIYVKDRVSLPNLEFVKDDVRNIARYGKFDAVFCSGVLYHLDQPCAFLKLLGEVTREIVLVQSHYAAGENGFFPPSKKKPSPMEWKLRLAWVKWRKRINRFLPPFFQTGKYPYCLSGPAVNEGKLGRWYFEYEPDKTPEAVEKLGFASYGNPVSFWLCKKDLLQTLLTSGFKIVYEQYDCLGNIRINRYIENHSRSLFVGIKYQEAAFQSSRLTNHDPGVTLESNENSVL